MKLTSLIGSNSSPYLEYAWVPANATVAGQAIAANTLTTLTLDTEVADTDGNGSVSSNLVTLAAGTYLYDLSVPATFGPGGVAILALFNSTLSSSISRRNFDGPPAAYSMAMSGGASGTGTGTGGASWSGNLTNSQYIPLTMAMSGQFKLTASQAIGVRIVSATAITIGGGITLATAGLDQRTTLQLWKLA